MKVFCIDTATTACHLALCEGEKKCAESYQAMRHGHAVHLLPAMELILKEVKWSYEDIDVFAVTVGPGSFTGIRVGLAAVNAIALSLNKPIIGLSNLEALALTYEDQPVVVAIDTYCGDFFTQSFTSKGKAESEPFCMDRQDIEDQYLCYNKVFDQKLDMLAVGQYVQEIILQKRVQDYKAAPVYVKKPEAKRAKNLPDILWNS